VNGVNGTAAVFFGTGRPFELRHYPVPDPEPGAVVVAVSVANVCGSDLHMWRGDLDLGRLKLPMPVVLGHEAVGSVVALGDGVSVDWAGDSLAVGDRVAWRYFYPCGRCRACTSGATRACQQNHRFISHGRSSEDPPHFVGAYATHHYLLPGHAVFKVPEGLADEVAAGANCAMAEAIQGLETVGLRPGETVAIQGAGGVGIYACAVAKAMGAARVVVLDGVAERLQLAEDFGADVVLNLEELPNAKDRVRAVKEATGGEGADVVGEFVGHASAVAEGINMVAPGGRYLEVGCVHTGRTFAFDPAYVTLLSRSVVGVIYYEPWALQRALRFLAEHRERFPWDSVAGAPYSLANINQAFEDAAARRVPRAAVAIG
jgi:D-arabinose 1-dehydrogenase-like Zn-dependent alcohol dehydrogenase